MAYRVARALQRTVGGLGGLVVTEWSELRHTAAVIGTVLFFSVRPTEREVAG